MIVTALVNTTYKRAVVLAGQSVDMDDATAKTMLAEKLVRKGKAALAAETESEAEKPEDKKAGGAQ